MRKKRRAVRDSFGNVSHYTNAKTIGLRHLLTGKIVKRINKKEAAKRGIYTRTYTINDTIRKRKKRATNNLL
ncbi:MAG: hypothetical protein HYU56_00110 [Candidatus Aenigmarchaeota archaeon]|nr:hypothetical protein [Candidatus Aenigmarchaeota archaeon]